MIIFKLLKMLPVNQLATKHYKKCHSKLQTHSNPLITETHFMEMPLTDLRENGVGIYYV